MQKGITLVMRIVALASLGLLILVLGEIMDPTVFDIWAVLDLLGLIRDLVSYVAYIILVGLMSGLIVMVSGILSIFVNANVFYYMALVFAYQIVGRWFYLPTFSDANIVPSVDQAASELLKILFSFKDMWYTLVLNAFLLILTFYVIRWIVSADTTYGINIIVVINGILFVPMFIYGLREFIVYLTVTIAGNFGIGGGGTNVLITYLDNLLSISILRDNFFMTYSENSNQTFVDFITSPVFFVAAASFVFLEFIFQLNYVDLVTRPSIDREERLSTQIRVLKVEAERAVGSIKQIEEKKRQEELLRMQTGLGAETDAAATAAKKADSRKGQGDELKDYMAESSGAHFSYISELIERKKLEREQKSMMDAMKDTRRLSYYLDKLFKQDKQAYGNLTAKTSAPSARGLVRSTIFNLVFRISIITILTWSCMHPIFVFENLFLAPESISNSVELRTPEAVLSIFLPFVMLIPLASTIIRVTKHNKLKELLRMEEIQRSGLTEEEFEKLQAQRSSVSGAESQVGISQDANATPQQPAAAASTPNPPNP